MPLIAKCFLLVLSVHFAAAHLLVGDDTSVACPKLPPNYDIDEHDLHRYCVKVSTGKGGEYKFIEYNSSKDACEGYGPPSIVWYTYAREKGDDYAPLQPWECADLQVGKVANQITPCAYWATKGPQLCATEPYIRICADYYGAVESTSISNFCQQYGNTSAKITAISFEEGYAGYTCNAQTEPEYA